MFHCEKCGCCCKAMKCDLLKDNLCSIYADRPIICRVDKMAECLGMTDSEANAINKKNCRILQQRYR